MKNKDIEKLVVESVKKFGRTYQMLEEYDRKSPELSK